MPKFGMYGFAQHDNTLIALSGNDPDAGAVDFPATRQKANGDLEAFWLEDQYKATSWLTLNAGVRVTHFSGLVTKPTPAHAWAQPLRFRACTGLFAEPTAAIIRRLRWIRFQTDILSATGTGQGFFPLRRASAMNSTRSA